MRRIANTAPQDTETKLTIAAFASQHPGCGVLSGQTMPLMQNWPSCGASPKSPP